MPQIELMQSDLPHTLYNGKEREVVVDDNAIRLTQESVRKARERRKKNEQQPVSVDELFK